MTEGMLERANSDPTFVKRIVTTSRGLMSLTHFVEGVSIRQKL